MKKRMSLNDVLAALVLVIYFAELVFPLITTLLPSAIVCLVCFILWLFFATTTDTKFLLWKKNFLLLTIYAFLAIYPLIFGYNVISNRYLSMSFVLCGAIVFRYYYYYEKLNILKKVILITLVLSFITMIITYGQLLLNPFIVRSIKSSGEYSAMLARQGIGGYSFVYYIAALSVPALYIGIKEKRRVVRVLAMLWYVFSIVFSIKSNYMTAFLTVVVCSVILIMMSTTMSKRWCYFLGILYGVLLIIVGLNVDNIISMISDFLPIRISRVLVTNSGNSVIDSIMQEFLSDRWPVILSSINAFLEHPILGVVGSGTLGYDETSLTGFGQHSFIADTFSLYGLFGGFIGTFAAVCPLKRSDIWKNNSPLRIAMIVCVIMIYFFNNATESIAIVISIIAPFCACMLNFDEV